MQRDAFLARELLFEAGLLHFLLYEHPLGPEPTHFVGQGLCALMKLRAAFGERSRGAAAGVASRVCLRTGERLHHRDNVAVFRLDKVFRVGLVVVAAAVAAAVANVRRQALARKFFAVQPGRLRVLSVAAAAAQEAVAGGGAEQGSFPSDHGNPSLRPAVRLQRRRRPGPECRRGQPGSAGR